MPQSEFGVWSLAGGKELYAAAAWAPWLCTLSLHHPWTPGCRTNDRHHSHGIITGLVIVRSEFLSGE